MPELKFLHKDLRSSLSIKEIRHIIDSLDEKEILEKTTTDNSFKIVIRANDHFGYGLIFLAKMEEMNNGETAVRISSETRQDFVWLNLIFIGLILSIVIFDNIRINGEIHDLTTRLMFALSFAIITLLLNSYMIFVPSRFLKRKVITRIKAHYTN
ncbi:hypothetical protein [Marinoscillum pacificum]|uniref:hypothetical protein n=1 Tax=Marinoscillum pacificum TaxID=392723 RepID=UPI00215802B3|nr:hypothetical protein [Marinoscillum pacificum]